MRQGVFNSTSETSETSEAALASANILPRQNAQCRKNGVQDLARRMSPAKDRHRDAYCAGRGTVATGGDRKTDVDNRVGKGSMEPQKYLQTWCIGWHWGPRSPPHRLSCSLSRPLAEVILIAEPCRGCMQKPVRDPWKLAFTPVCLVCASHPCLPDTITGGVVCV